MNQLYIKLSLHHLLLADLALELVPLFLLLPADERVFLFTLLLLAFEDREVTLPDEAGDDLRDVTLLLRFAGVELFRRVTLAAGLR